VRLPAKAGLHDEIVQVSIQLGSELGEEGLTMRAIAARLGVSATALYQHFESKGAILREIRLHGVRKLQQTLETVQRTGDVAARLADIGTCYVEFALENPWLYKVLFFGDEVVLEEVDDSERADLLAPLQTVRACMDEGMQNGRFRRDLAVDHMVLMMWSSLHGLATMLLDGRISAEHPVFPVADVKRFVRQYITGVAKALEATAAPT
jgi:AcrR family transcriptional regulator